MKRTIYLCLLLTLGLNSFTSCEKKEAKTDSKNSVNDEKYIVIDDVQYDISILKIKMAKFFNIEVDKIGYDSSSQSLYLIGYSGAYKIVDMIPTLNDIEL